jgi:hypothetical protein
MRFFKTALYLAVGLFLVMPAPSLRAATSQPASDEVPKILISGMEAYKNEGPEAAIKAWIKGSPIDGSRDALSQANVLRQVQDFYGAYKSYELIKSRDLTPTTRILYFTLDYEKGPLFAKFLIYRTEQGWIVVNFAFNTKEEVIIPSVL